jgi:beta-xylosidase
MLTRTIALAVLVMTAATNGLAQKVARSPAFLYQADPTIFADQGRYYLYGTDHVAKGIQVYESGDLHEWRGPVGRDSGFALLKGHSFGTGRFWAPQILRYRGRYVMAYAADEHIAVARGDDPRGPFTQKTPHALMAYRAIDPFIFVDDDGRVYLYYVKLQAGNRIYVTELSQDLSHPVAGTDVSCVNAVDDPQPWENTGKKTWTVTEGPTVLKHGGWYYLFYSANGFKSPDYAVGYAVSRTPTGPWKKYRGNPILSRSLVGVPGTGHGDFFRDGADSLCYVFHTHYAQGVVGPRKTALIRGAFVKDKGPDRMVLYPASFYYLRPAPRRP